ncbi:hypothetical protein PHET_04640 [Paragonimus heterotremus]|uniref:UBR-type domain-containing protein n=1 Tax=Paragonimus heterotremus TaxID=100268 RepID=A0A8J4SQ63_9TREM|nr:hypothetical protein PHET_04640 [Paragonimus heterotremus]
MSSIFLFAQDYPKHDIPTSEIQRSLHERLKEISEQIKKDGVSMPDVLRPLTQHSILQTVIGPSHLAFRLEDGRVCRVSYSVRSDRAPQKLDVKRKNGSQLDASASLRDGSSARTGSGHRTSRGISFLREMQRQGIYLTRPVTSQIHANEVPENLIEECQTVLEGKSRQVIIRELQHTNLDVNMAVNNLLSRDDEVEQSNSAPGDGGPGGLGSIGAEDWDDESVDLLSFFEYPDNHILFESDGIISDERIEPPTSPRNRAELSSEYDCGYLSDRRKRRRMEAQLPTRNNDVYHSLSLNGSNDTVTGRSAVSDSLQSVNNETSGGEITKQPVTPNSTRHAVQLGDVLEFWPSPDNREFDLRFSDIAALHSELVGLSTHGELHQWRWSNSRPFSPTVGLISHIDSKGIKKHVDNHTAGDNWTSALHSEIQSPKPDIVYYHPRTASLGLSDERIVKLSGCATRATVMTASGKFATWIDESLARSLSTCSTQTYLPPKLLSFEHRATTLYELRDETVMELHTAPLITVVRCQSGAVYWWGIYPPYMRQRLIEKSRQHRSTSSFRTGHDKGKPDISSGRPTSAGSQRTPGNTSSDNVEHNSQNSARTPSVLSVAPGSFVRMKSAPIFHAGAVGFTVAGGVPKVGTLLEDAWRITDVCRFRVSVTSSIGNHVEGFSGHPSSVTQDDPGQHVLTCPHALASAVSSSVAGSSALPNQNTAPLTTVASPNPSVMEQSNVTGSLTFQEMPPPPSPASSTCSDQSGPVRVSPGTFKRKKVSSTSSDRGDRAVSDSETGNRAARGKSVDRDSQGTTHTSALGLLSSTARRLTTLGDTNSISNDSLPKSTSSAEEDWCLSDVIFLEDGRTQPVGIVLKVDGNIAAVKFLKDQERACLASNCPYSPVCSLVSSITSPGSATQSASMNLTSLSIHQTVSANALATTAFPDPMAWVNDCRLLRKDDLTIVRYADCARVPEFIQRTPRRIFAYPHQSRATALEAKSSGKSSSASTPTAFRSKLLAIAPENNRVHVIVDQSSHPSRQQLAYQVYNLSGKMLAHHKLPPAGGAVQSASEAATAPGISLVCPAEHPLLLRDATGLVYPFIPTSRSGGSHETLSNFPLLDLPPVQCASFFWLRSGRTGTTGTTASTNAAQSLTTGRQGLKYYSEQPSSTNCLLGLVIVQDLTLMQHVLRANYSQLERVLSPDCEAPSEVNQRLASEMVDGRRNLLHVAVTMCAPQSNKETSPEWTSKLDRILADPLNLTATVIVQPELNNEKNESLDKRASNSSGSGSISGRPSSTFWSSIARSTAKPGCLSMHELFIRSSIEAAAVAAAASASTAGNGPRSDDREPVRSVANGTNFWHWPPVRKDELTRRVASYRIVRLLVESHQLRAHLPHLMAARTTDNLTPFMLAVKCRAYNVARFLYQAIQYFIVNPVFTHASIPISPASSYRDYVFPVDSRPDDSPLFLLCFNDTCSFTWTGPDHIRQDIFECRTCGLMDSLCCCTECARVCHRGHDCRLKRTSPTAYCDCWEKCRCQSLISGAQAPRQELFYRLLQDTDLIRLINSKNEHLMLFLVKCVERQLREQKQHRPSRRRLGSLTARPSATNAPTHPASSASGTQPSNWDVTGSSSSTVTPEEPDHDLDPPRFARDALELALDCAHAVESILNLDQKPFCGRSHSSGTNSAALDEEKLLFTQGGTTQLDDFVFTLVCKCPSELVDILITTLNRNLLPEVSVYSQVIRDGNASTQPDTLGKPSDEEQRSGVQPPNALAMRQAAGRFVRSVARVFTSLSMELTADHKKKKGRLLLNQPAPLDICRHIFSRLAPVTLVELPMLAIGLLTPLRTSTLLPSLPFSLVTQSTDAIQGLEQLFVTERNTFTRQQLLNSFDPTRMTDINPAASNTTEWHNLLMRTGDERRASHTSTATRSSLVDVRNCPSASIDRTPVRPMFVSALNVDLSVPQDRDNTSTADVTVPHRSSTYVSITYPEDHDVHSTNQESAGPNQAVTPFVPSNGVPQTDTIPERMEVSGATGSHFMNDDASAHSSVVESFRDWRPPQDTSEMEVINSSSGHQGLTILNEATVGFQSQHREETESLPKRRRTLHEASAVTNTDVEHLQSVILNYDDAVNLVDEEDRVRTSFSLIDGENSVSQASSTGATIATVAGSTLDTLDAASDVTNVSVDTVCNVGADSSAIFVAVSQSENGANLSRPPSSTALTLNQPTDLNEFSYTGLLNSDEVYRPSDSAATIAPHARTEDNEDDEPENRHINDEEDGDNGLTSRPRVTVQFPADDNSDGQVSDYDDDDDEDDDEDVDPDEDDGEENEDEEEDDNETDDDDADEDGYGDDAEELIEAEDDDDDDDNDDESSHHSDASSVDAGSRSASPTWVPWSQNSVFSRLSSRSAVPPAATDDGSVSLTSTDNRRAVDSSGPTSVAVTSSTGAGTATPAVSLRSNSNSSRRIVQPVISLLSTTAPSTTTPTLVVSGSGVASSTFGGDTTAMVTSTGATDGGCIINTQVYLSRAFGCLMRVMADLIAELRENTGSSVSMLRRCASAPTALLPLLSVYEQQRQLSIYNPNTTSSSCSTSVSVSSTNSHPHTLLLSSPMSTNNLNSVAFPSRSFGPTLTDLHSNIFQPSYSIQNSLPYLGSSTSSSVLGSSAALSRLSSAARPDSHFHATISENELVELVAAIGVAMSPIWQWLSDALDNLEAQLRFSSAWTGRFRRGTTDPHSWSVNISDGSAAGRHESNVSINSVSRHSSSVNQLSSGRGTSHRLSGNLSSGSTGNSRPDQSSSSTVPDSASTDSNVLTQRTDFLSYLFSLMRASGGDHGDSVPFVSPTVHKHLAYVLDALLYFFKVFETAWPSGLSHHLWMALDRPNWLSKPCEFPALNLYSPNSGPAPQTLRENKVEKDVSTANLLGGHVAQREDSFFRRSESILSLSGFGLDLIDTPLSEALPLALQPQRLHSTSSRTELFGSARYFTGNPADLSTASIGAVSSSDTFPVCLNAARSAWGSAIAEGGRRARPYLNKILQCTDGADVIPEASLTQLTRRELCVGSGFLDSIGHPATLLSRWCMSLEFFGRHFASDVGAEHRSYILDLGGFTVKEARFRKQMDRLRTVSRRDVVLEVERERSSLIFSTVRQLNAEYAKRQSQTTPSSSSAGGNGLSTLTPPTATGLGRYSVGHCPVGQSSSGANNNLRPTGSDPSPIAVALLLGTTTDSPLLGTLFGASPAPVTPVTNGSPSLGQGSPALLSCQRVKVAFRDEPGEGSGVARSFFTAFSEAVLAPEPLPPFTTLLQPAASSNSTSTNSISQSYAPILFHHRHYTTLSRAPSVSRSPSTPGYTFSNTITVGGSSAGSGANRSGLAPGSGVNVTGSSRSAEATGTGSGVSISFYPYQSQSRLTSRRARTSAWRRAGGLSAGATPFYPTSNSEIVVTDPTSVMHSPPHSHSPIQTVASVPSSPTHDGAVTSSNDTTLIPGLSPGASPSSQHGVQETGRRTLLLRSSLLSVPLTDAVGSVPSVEPTAAQQTSDTSVGNRLFARVQSLTGYEELSARITGMLLELPPTEHVILLNNEDALRNRVEEARAVLTMSDSGEREHSNLHRIRSPPPSSAQSHQPILERLVNRREATQSSESPHATASATKDAHTPVTTTTTATVQPCADTAIEPERVPLFWQPGLQGYYFPRAVPGVNLTTSSAIDPVNLAARYSIYRGVGRVIGFCLLTNETCPIQFNRPVLNYLLGRVLHWHDFAFYDPTTYEGLRHLLRSASPETEESVVDYNLTFSIIPAHEEGGLNPGSVVNQQGSTLSRNLAPNGDEVDVTDANVYEFVKRYAEFKMVDAVREPLEQLRLGVFDVLPRNALDGLTAEDLRLLLNGAGDIDTEVLVSYTTFHDETRCGSAAAVGKAFENGGSSSHLEKVSRLKRWFWNTVRAMDTKQRQNLLYFWTSSPTLPASAQGFQPMPSINIRPADDHHLPTANTCISRLYLPLYSSKHILREKLLQAIETKSFGFV